MPWDKENYPESLKNFTAPVRYKAIDIANALLKDGYEEGRAISIATAQAKEWGRITINKLEKKANDQRPKHRNKKSRTAFINACPAAYIRII